MLTLVAELSKIMKQINWHTYIDVSRWLLLIRLLYLQCINLLRTNTKVKFMYPRFILLFLKIKPAYLIAY
jgi:hypothetical protein